MGMREEVFAENPPGLLKSLSGSTAGIAGCGGIGSNVALMLARAGVGKLILVDSDVVSERDLNRQCYFSRHISMPKVEALRQEILGIGGGTGVKAREKRIDSKNACRLFKGCDLLVEALGLDRSKRLVLKAWLSGMPGTPVVACSSVAGMGPGSTVRIDRKDGITVVGDRVPAGKPGTLSARVSLAASLMALEAVGILAGEAPGGDSGSHGSGTGPEVTCNGARIPLSRFPAEVLEETLRGLLSVYRGVDSQGELRVRLPGTGVSRRE